MQIISVLRLLSIPFCFLLFLTGFFPLKGISNGYSTKKIVPSVDPYSASNSSYATKSEALKHERKSSSPTYKRVVLMIIDALRDDFVKSEFNFVPKARKHIRNGHGLAFTAQTHPPTVTLPRIKAITTGTIPGFIDVVLNFGSTVLSEDNIVTQMKINKKKIVFYGDDTWMNLFPDHFHSYDATSSFFVTDYTEVDNNVTRHLSSQLQANVDWDAMILHYLGLDHIGHMSGPNSPLIRPKLAEMDSVIDRIYSAMETWESHGIPSVLVICGDHGMSDQGGHGGSSPSEILVPLIFLSPSISTRESLHGGLVSQTDLCPTLSVLLGLPVPLNSLGKVIHDTLMDYSLPQKVSVLHQNAQHVLRVFKTFVKDVDRESGYLLYALASDKYKKWLKAHKEGLSREEWEKQGNHLLGMFSESLSLMAERASRLSSQYDVYAMTTSISLLWLLILSIIMSLLKKDLTLPKTSITKQLSLVIPILGSALMSHIIMCTGGLPSTSMCGSSPFNIGVQLFIAEVLLCSGLHLLSTQGSLMPWKQQIMQLAGEKCVVEWFLVLATICHTFTLLSSSFVEEEHQTFYFLTISVHILLLGHVGITFITSQRLFHCQNTDLMIEHSKGTETYDYISKVKDGPILRDQGDRNRASYNNSEDTFMEITSRHNADYPESNHHQGKDCATSLIDNFKEIRYSNDKEILMSSVYSRKKYEVQFTSASREGVQIVNIMSLKEMVHIFVSVVAILVLLRVLRRWNQTGNKWMNLPDYGDWLVNPENKATLSLVVLFSLVIIAASRSISLPRLQAMCVNLSLVFTYITRAASGTLIFPDRRFITDSGVLEARASYIFMGLIVLLSMLPLTASQTEDRKKSDVKAASKIKVLKEGKNITKTLGKTPPKFQTVHNREFANQNSSSVPTSKPAPQPMQTEGKGLKDLFSVKSDLYSSLFNNTHHDRRVHIVNGVLTAWLCFMCLVLRPHNIPVVALMSLIEQMAVYVVIKAGLKPMPVLLYSLWMGHAFFFFQGNSNSISTVDVSAGYVGVTEYIPALIGLLMALSTYSGLIYWLISFLRTMCLLYPGNEGNKRLKLILQNSLNWLSLKMAFPLAVYCIVVATQRYHLFVWTVFSPKLLYQAMESGILAAVGLGFYAIQRLL